MLMIEKKMDENKSEHPPNQTCILSNHCNILLVPKSSCGQVSSGTSRKAFSLPLISINKLGLSGFSLLIIVCTFRPWWSLGGRADGGFVYAMSRKQTPREPVLLDAAEASEDESSPLCAEYYRVSPPWVHYKPTAIPLLAHCIPSNDCFETDLLNLHFRIKQFFHCSCVNSG